MGIGGVAEAFELGFRALGRGLLHVVRVAWSVAKKLGVLYLALWAVVTVLAHPNLLGAVMVVSGFVAFFMYRKSLRTSKDAADVARQAELTVQESEKLRADEHARCLDLESEVQRLEIAVAAAYHAIAATEGTMALGRDSVVSALQVAVSRLLAVVEGMDDQRRAVAILDAVEQLRILSGQLEDDDATAAAIAARIDGVNELIRVRMDRIITEGIERLAEAGYPGAKITPGGAGWIQP